MEYGSLALFYDITDQEVEAMIHCFCMRRCQFQTGQTICTYGENAGEVGVLTRGEAELVRLDYAGNRTILERLETGGVFGESLAFTPLLGDCVEVVSAGSSEVLFMEYSHIMKRCENACAHHSKLVQNMFRLVAEQTRRGQLHPALHPQRPGGLHQRGPQRHDAGAEADEGGGARGDGRPPGDPAHRGGVAPSLCGKRLTA